MMWSACVCVSVVGPQTHHPHQRIPHIHDSPLRKVDQLTKDEKVRACVCRLLFRGSVDVKGAARGGGGGAWGVSRTGGDSCDAQTPLVNPSQTISSTNRHHLNDATRFLLYQKGDRRDVGEGGAGRRARDAGGPEANAHAGTRFALTYVYVWCVALWGSEATLSPPPLFPVYNPSHHTHTYLPTTTPPTYPRHDRATSWRRRPTWTTSTGSWSSPCTSSRPPVRLSLDC